MRITALSGGVGGARMLRGFADLPGVDLTAIVNVGDDDTIYGLHLAPDLDTVTYTLARVSSAERGWGRTGETWHTMAELETFPIDTAFRLGDKDLALNLFRTARLGDGAPLSRITAEIAESFGIHTTILPASDDPIRTKVRAGDRWLAFQDYFVRRHHSDTVDELRFEGASDAAPAPGVIEAIDAADAIVIGPSNPFLSIWPILAVPGISEAILRKERIMAVSPLVGGKAVKGPLGELLPALGYQASNSGIVRAYDGILTDLVVDRGDAPPDPPGVPVFRTADTLIAESTAARVLARTMVSWLA